MGSLLRVLVGLMVFCFGFLAILSILYLPIPSSVIPRGHISVASTLHPEIGKTASSDVEALRAEVEAMKQERYKLRGDLARTQKMLEMERREAEKQLAEAREEAKRAKEAAKPAPPTTTTTTTTTTSSFSSSAAAALAVVPPSSVLGSTFLSDRMPLDRVAYDAYRAGLPRAYFHELTSGDKSKDPGRPRGAGGFTRMLVIGDSNLRDGIDTFLLDFTASGEGAKWSIATVDCGDFAVSEEEKAKRGGVVAKHTPARQLRWDDKMYFLERTTSTGVNGDILLSFRFHDGDLDRLKLPLATTEEVTEWRGSHGHVCYNWADEDGKYWTPPLSRKVERPLLNYYDVVFYFPSLWGLEQYVTQRTAEYVHQFDWLDTFAASGRVSRAGPSGLPHVIVLNYGLVGRHERFGEPELTKMRNLVARETEAKPRSYKLLEQMPSTVLAKSVGVPYFDWGSFHWTQFTMRAIWASTARYISLLNSPQTKELEAMLGKAKLD